MIERITGFTLPSRVGREPRGRTSGLVTAVGFLLFVFATIVTQMPIAAQPIGTEDPGAAMGGQTGRQVDARVNRPAGVAQPGAIRGRVIDSSGGVIVGARVRITSGPGRGETVSDDEGRFSIEELPPGSYRLRISAPDFYPYSTARIPVESGQAPELDILLEVAVQPEEITVSPADFANRISATLGTLVLTGEALESLPSGPGGLPAMLRLLAPASVNPRRPEFIVDGFRQRRLPPRHAIREIRINENPFSAEYSEPGVSRIEILTRPGSERFHGLFFVSFNDAGLNSRDPFAASRTAYQSRLFRSTLSGPIVDGRASFFIDAERRDTENTAVINATVLDPEFNIRSLNQTVLTPEGVTRVSPRLDLQLGPRHALVARYSHNRLDSQNAGVGDFSLLSRAYGSVTEEDSLQLTETAVLNANAINETRFQYAREQHRQEGDNREPAIHVPQAFSGGGSQMGRFANHEDRWELQNYTLWNKRRHTLKGGAQIQAVQLRNRSSSNFGGTFTFAGGLAPLLDQDNRVVVAPNGEPLLVPITTIERYRRTLFFQEQGLDPARIRELGGGAHQLSLAGGEEGARVSQHEIGLFLQDDWNLRDHLTLSFGVRWEGQNNIGRDLDFAPRLGFAWAPGGSSSSPKTLLRGGFGIFYDRFSHTYTLRARRLNGINQREFIVSDPQVLDLFPAVPSLEQLEEFELPATLVRVAEDLRAPYTMQTNLTFERRLPPHFTLVASLVNSRTLHAFRSRNINAPLPAHALRSRNVSAPFSEPTGVGPRPFPELGEIFQYESSGIARQNQLNLTATHRFGNTLTGYVTYMLSEASSDTDGPETFPATSYDLRNEFGPSALDARHSFFWGAWIDAPWGLKFTSLYVYRSGLPFNITTGTDLNGDSLFTERPAFAAEPAGPNVVVTPLGAFDLSPGPDQSMIPRNWGRGPSFSSLSLSVSRTFQVRTESAERPAGSDPGRWGRRFYFRFAAQVENLLNRVNPRTPVGNLSSSRFGQSYGSAGAYGFGNNPAGNRQILLQFHWHF